MVAKSLKKIKLSEVIVIQKSALHKSPNGFLSMDENVWIFGILTLKNLKKLRIPSIFLYIFQKLPHCCRSVCRPICHLPRNCLCRRPSRPHSPFYFRICLHRSCLCSNIPFHFLWCGLWNCRGHGRRVVDRSNRPEFHISKDFRKFDNIFFVRFTIFYKCNV